MADIIDFEKAKGEKEGGEGDAQQVFPCVCGNVFWIKTSEGDFCGFCDMPFDWLEFDTE